jgi:glycosyltransferase involved in cell wall biosynthesis
MRVLIAAASFPSSMSGLPRHAFNTARYLLQHPDVSQVHLVVAPWQRHLVEESGVDPRLRIQMHVAAMDRSSMSRNLWYFRRLPELAAQVEADIVHFSYPMPVNQAAFRCSTVVTLHDLYPYEIPSNFGFPKVIFNRLVLQQCLRGADAIICISGATLRLLKRYAPARVWKKAVRIYNCVEAPSLCAMESPIPDWRGEPFFLCVAQHRRNKNIPLLIEAFHLLRHRAGLDSALKLVVVGIGGPESERIRRLISAFDLGNDVHLLEGLSEPELQWCYARCEALAAPSITEGFGAPVVEALLAGCRVVCSDIPAFREVANADCRFVALDRNAPNALADALCAAMRSPEQEPIAFPQCSARVFTESYVSLYRSLLCGSPSQSMDEVSSVLRVTSSERQSL